MFSIIIVIDKNTSTKNLVISTCRYFYGFSTCGESLHTHFTVWTSKTIDVLQLLMQTGVMAKLLEEDNYTPSEMKAKLEDL